MARRYDSRTTIFSPEGRLFQVEYAMKAINHAGAAVGILTNEGVVFAAEKKVTSPLLDEMARSDKLFKVDDHCACCVAGITADANILVNYSRLISQRYTFSYQEHMPLELLVRQICDTKQGYTQYGGLRPFGVSFLWAGWDKHFGFQLYQSDPSGNYSGWKATAIGQNNTAATSILKQDYDEDKMDLEGGLGLALKVMSKTMDSTALTGEKLEVATLSRVDGRVCFHVFTQEEVAALVERTPIETTD